MTEITPEYKIHFPDIKKQEAIVEAIEKELEDAKSDEEKASIIRKHINGIADTY